MVMIRELGVSNTLLGLGMIHSHFSPIQDMMIEYRLQVIFLVTAVFSMDVHMVFLSCIGYNPHVYFANNTNTATRLSNDRTAVVSDIVSLR